MRRGAGRAFVGFLLTVMLTVVLTGTCFGISLKTTVFSGNGFKDLIKNMDLGAVMEEIMLESLEEADKEANNGLGNSGIKFTETIMSEDVISDVTDILIDGMLEDKEVDFSVVKDGCMNALTDMSNQAVEDVLDEIKNTTNVVDAESLKNNSIIQQYQEEFNIDVTTPILEQLETVYGSKSVNLDDVDLAEVKAEAKDAINDKVMPDIEDKVDEFIEETNVEMNRELATFRAENDIESVTDIFDPIFGVILKSIIIGSVAAVIVILLQILVYKKDMNKAVKNIGIACLFVTIAMVVFSLLCSVIANLLADMFTTGSAVDNAIISIIDSTIPKIGGASRIIAIITGVLFVVLIVVAVILKKFASKEETQKTNNTVNNITSGNSYGFNVVADQTSTSNNMYGQQLTANGMYGQQPAANGMYGQQPAANGMYGQQPAANGMYGQQPTANGMYVEQPATNDAFVEQAFTNESTNNDQM